MSPINLLLSLTFLVYIDIRILTPILPSISLSLDSSPGAVGLAMTTYSFAYGLGQLIYGPLSDRLSRIAVVRAAGIGFCIFTILAALSMTTWQFICIRLLAGAFAGAVIPLTMVFIGDTVEYNQRQAVLGRVSAISSVAMAFSASIGGTVAYFVSWRIMLLGYGLLALVPIGLMWRLKNAAPVKTPETSERYRDFLRDPRALFIYAAVFLEGFLLWGGMTYFGSFASLRYHFDQFTVGLFIAVFGTGTMAGSLMIGRIRRFLSENAMAALGGILMGVSFLVLIPRWPSPVFAVSMLGMGLGFVGLHTTLLVRGTEISSTARGQAYSLFPVSNFSGIATGSAVFGWLVDAGRYEAMFMIAGAGLIGIGLATARSPLRPPRSPVPFSTT
jgi:predicted MFS family arabinose efflux permease